mgnify:CR=1 FL=1
MYITITQAHVDRAASSTTTSSYKTCPVAQCLSGRGYPYSQAGAKTCFLDRSFTPYRYSRKLYWEVFRWDTCRQFTPGRYLITKEGV